MRQKNGFAAIFVQRESREKGLIKASIRQVMIFYLPKRHSSFELCKPGKRFRLPGNPLGYLKIFCFQNTKGRVIDYPA